MEQDTPRLGRNTRSLKGSTDNKERNARFNTSFCQFTVLQSGLSQKTNTALAVQRWCSPCCTRPVRYATWCMSHDHDHEGAKPYVRGLAPCKRASPV